MKLFSDWTATWQSISAAFLSLSSLSVVCDTATANREVRAESVLRMPLRFEVNQGQTSQDVHFVARGGRYNVFLAPHEVVVDLLSPPIRSEADLDAYHETGKHISDGHQIPTAAYGSGSIRMSFIGQKRNARLFGRGKLPGLSHYFVGQNPKHWKQNVLSYEKVEYEELYSGVNLVFYGNEGLLEYDFLVAPGADPSLIRMEFQGADDLFIDRNGNLVANKGGNELRFLRPLIYQVIDGNRKAVEGAFRTYAQHSAGGLGSLYEIGFEVGPYDSKHPLVIDPVLDYSTYFGGTSSEFGRSVAVDSAGNAYISGYTMSVDFPTANGLQRVRGTNAFSVFVSKFSPNGALEYSSYLGGDGYTGGDEGPSLVVDSSGSAYVTGSTKGKDFPTINAFQSQHSTGTLDWDVFVSKLSPDCSQLIFSTYLGGSPRLEVSPKSLNFGKVETGETKELIMKVRNTTSVPVKGNVRTNARQFQVMASDDTFNLPGGSEKEFVIQFAPTDNSQAFGTFIVEITEPRVNKFDSISINLTGNNDPGFTDPEPAVLLGDGTDIARGIALDGSGNVFVGGYTGSYAFPLRNPIQPILGGLMDAFVAKFSSSGELLYSTFVGGVGVDAAHGIAVDAEGHAHIAGATSTASHPITDVNTNNFPVTAGVLQPQYEDGSDAFVSKLNPEGNGLVYSTFLKKKVPGTPVALALDSNSNLYLAGFGITNFLDPSAVMDLPFIGGGDAFATKIDSQGKNILFSGFIGGTGFDDCTAITLDDAGNIYLTGLTSSTNFPVVDPVQSSLSGGNDAYVAKVNISSKTIEIATYLGGDSPFPESGYGIDLDPSNNIYVVGTTYSTNFPTANAFQVVNKGVRDLFLARIGGGGSLQEIQVWQRLSLTNVTGSTSTNDFKVEFVRVLGQTEIRVEAVVESVTGGVINVRVPVDLMGPNNVDIPPTGTQPIEVEIRKRSDNNLIVRMPFLLRFPQPIIVDELDVRRIPAVLRNLVHFLLEGVSPRIHTFSYLGRSVDGMMGLRVLNTELDFPQPFRFDGNVAVFEPGVTGGFQQASTFHIPSVGSGNEGLQFTVSRNGLYVFTIEAGTNSPGPFPGRYQFHLAGNVGLPRKLVNNVPEFRRGTRLDTLFNHPAPRPQNLTNDGLGFARSALFKFADRVSVSQAALAVLIPPTPTGFPLGSRVIRAADPDAALEITTPTARTPDCAAPVPGTVIDFTQVPDPASAEAPTPPGDSVCAVIGKPDGLAVTVPFNDVLGLPLSSVILDLGSGQEAVNGTGADFRVVALSGNYTVAVGNTPYAGTFVSFAGTKSSTSDFDLTDVGLSSARYILLTAAPSFVLDGVQNLNTFADLIDANLGPMIQSRSATLLARRAKNTDNALDPFIQLIAPGGSLFAENESGFGDDLSLDRSDSAIVNASLTESGFYRYLVKGFDKQPDEQSFGTFFTRLETPGNYDPVEIQISDRDEGGTQAQKNGIFLDVRQRDSYLFQSAGGTLVNIVASASGNSSLNPVIEVYDPEDFLIAANDDFSGRGKNAAVSVTLPPVSVAGIPLPNPSTYRVVVSAVDEPFTASPVTGGVAYTRRSADGTYELKVFTGTLTGGETPPTAPQILSVDPPSSAAGSQITIRGAHFDPVAANNIVRFGKVQASVVTATPTQLVVIVPSGLPAGPSPITVSVGALTSASISFTPTIGPSETIVDVRMHSFSLRVRPATSTIDGQNYTLELTSLLPGAPANGELYPLFDPLDYSHSSDFAVKSSVLPEPLQGFLFLDIPLLGDSNQNGLDDFFESTLAVNRVQTFGEFIGDFADGSVTATWSRDSGTEIGKCEIQFRGNFAGLLPNFDCQFEILEYSGTTTYTRSDANSISATVDLSRAPLGLDQWHGPLILTKGLEGITNVLRLSRGQWKNSAGQSMTFFDASLEQNQTNRSIFSGLFSFEDGDITTEDEDYYNWMFVLADNKDANGNGIPDIIDGSGIVPGEIRRLAVTVSGATLRFVISGEANKAYQLEEISELGSGAWTIVSLIPVSGESQTVLVPVPASKTKFYRLKERQSNDVKR